MIDSSDARPALPRLHLVTDDEVVGAPGFPTSAAAALEAGGEDLAFHLRAPRAGGRELLRIARRLAPVAASVGATFIVNARVDVAQAARASGVQLPVRGVPVSAARALLGPERIVGASVHSPGEAAAAAEGGADFLLAGTLFPSRSHPGGRTSGLDWIADLRRLGLPIIGIGGITRARVPAALAAGAHGVAVLGAVWRSGDPARAVESLNDTIRKVSE